MPNGFSWSGGIDRFLSKQSLANDSYQMGRLFFQAELLSVGHQPRPSGTNQPCWINRAIAARRQQPLPAPGRAMPAATPRKESPPAGPAGHDQFLHQTGGQQQQGTGSCHVPPPGCRKSAVATCARWMKTRLPMPAIKASICAAVPSMRKAAASPRRGAQSCFRFGVYGADSIEMGR